MPRLQSSALRAGFPAACGRPQALSVVVKAAAGKGNGSKTLHCVRHGITEMNMYLKQFEYDAADFKDPLMYDTILTPEGRAGAAQVASIAARLHPKPEVLLVSPLTRAIQTAQLAFPHHDGPVHVEPLCRERVWHASDIGQSPQRLQQAFQEDPRFKFEHLPDVWWYTGQPEKPLEPCQEPEDVFADRVQLLKQRLLERPEQCIAIVAHWGLLHELTGGHEFKNCEIKTYTLSGEGRVQQASVFSTMFR